MLSVQHCCRTLTASTVVTGVFNKKKKKKSPKPRFSSYNTVVVGGSQPRKFIYLFTVVVGCYFQFTQLKQLVVDSKLARFFI
jgi:hypothetical protein